MLTGRKIPPGIFFTSDFQKKVFKQKDKDKAKRDLIDHDPELVKSLISNYSEQLLEKEKKKKNAIVEAAYDGRISTIKLISDELNNFDDLVLNNNYKEELAYAQINKKLGKTNYFNLRKKFQNSYDVFLQTFGVIDKNINTFTFKESFAITKDKTFEFHYASPNFLPSN